MIDPTADPKKDHVIMCRGRVLGGGVALKSRPVGLVLRSGHRNVIDDAPPDDAEIKARLHGAVFNSQVATAVNRRFNTFQNGVKTGLAKAKSDQYIELQVHPRYKDDITRYVNVVRAVPIKESAPERMQRLAVLQSKLLDPAAAAKAAIELEAIGPEAVETLLKGLSSKSTEVRFYAAETLAFLDRREAAAPLGQIARDEPAFRVFALAALSTMQEYAAYEQLRGLLAAPQRGNPLRGVPRPLGDERKRRLRPRRTSRRAIPLPRARRGRPPHDSRPRQPYPGNRGLRPRAASAHPRGSQRRQRDPGDQLRRQ